MSYVHQNSTPSSDSELINQKLAGSGTARRRMRTCLRKSCVCWRNMEMKHVVRKSGASTELSRALRSHASCTRHDIYFACNVSEAWNVEHDISFGSQLRFGLSCANAKVGARLKFFGLSGFMPLICSATCNDCNAPGFAETMGTSSFLALKACPCALIDRRNATSSSAPKLETMTSLSFHRRLRLFFAFDRELECVKNQAHVTACVFIIAVWRDSRRTKGKQFPWCTSSECVRSCKTTQREFVCKEGPLNATLIWCLAVKKSCFEIWHELGRRRCYSTWCLLD